jgi:hypothetical protein
MISLSQQQYDELKALRREVEAFASELRRLKQMLDLIPDEPQQSPQRAHPGAQ